MIEVIKVQKTLAEVDKDNQRYLKDIKLVFGAFFDLKDKTLEIFFQHACLFHNEAQHNVFDWEQQCNTQRKNILYLRKKVSKKKLINKKKEIVKKKEKLLKKIN